MILLLQSCVAFLFEASDHSQLQTHIEMALEHLHCEVRLSALRLLVKKLKDGLLDGTSSSLTTCICQALKSETHPSVGFRFQNSMQGASICTM